MTLANCQRWNTVHPQRLHELHSRALALHASCPNCRRFHWIYCSSDNHGYSFCSKMHFLWSPWISNLAGVLDGSYSVHLFLDTEQRLKNPCHTRTSTVDVHDAFKIVQVKQWTLNTLPGWPPPPRQRLRPGRTLSNVDKLSMTSGW